MGPFLAFIYFLPSFYQALPCTHSIVMYEVTLLVQRLVNKYGMELEQIT